jgi:hypothetical protein
MKDTVPVGVGTFFRNVSTRAETVTLEPGATVSPAEPMEIPGAGYLTVMLVAVEVETA